MADRPAPLRGFRILDCCNELAVYATKLLVSLGAEVIRPEPLGGDPMRAFPPLVDGVSLYFEHFNAGKLRQCHLVSTYFPTGCWTNAGSGGYWTCCDCRPNVAARSSLERPSPTSQPSPPHAMRC